MKVHLWILPGVADCRTFHDEGSLSRACSLLNRRMMNEDSTIRVVAIIITCEYHHWKNRNKKRSQNECEISRQLCTGDPRNILLLETFRFDIELEWFYVAGRSSTILLTIKRPKNRLEENSEMKILQQTCDLNVFLFINQQVYSTCTFMNKCLISLEKNELFLFTR